MSTETAMTICTLRRVDRRLDIEQARSLLATVADPDHGAQPVAAGRRPRWWPGGPPKRHTAGPDGLPPLGEVIAIFGWHR